MKGEKISQFNFSSKNKKGFTLLGEKTVGILIALLCIIFLVYVLAAIFSSTTTSEKEKQAESVLNGENGIITTINTAENKYDFLINSPSGWYLFGFTETKPNSCLSENCLCFCKKTGAIANFFNDKAQIEKCDEDGVCAVVSNLGKSFEIEIEKGESTSISIIQLNGKVEITEN